MNDFGSRTAAGILAGGKSRRMAGYHKGSLLTPEGRTFTEKIADEMKKITDTVYISYGNIVQTEVDGCRVVRDIYKNCGPLGGLQAVLSRAADDGAEAVMVAACDMPFADSDLYQYMYRCLLQESGMPDDCDAMKAGQGSSYSTEADGGAAVGNAANIDGRTCVGDTMDRAFAAYDGVAAKVGDRIHPLAAIYRVGAVETFEKQIKKNNYRLRDAIAELNILYVDLEGTRYEKMLVNINTEKDYNEMTDRKSDY